MIRTGEEERQKDNTKGGIKIGEKEGEENLKPLEQNI